MNLYIGNLAGDVNDEDLRQAFSIYGQVTSAKVIIDKYNNLSRGFGFVEMPDNSEADTAIKALNGENLKGKAIKISEAKPRSAKKRDNRRRGYGGGRNW